MITLTAAEIASLTGGTLSGVAPDAVVTGPVVIDSRKAMPGGLFAATVGEHVDGHDFAGRAAGAGAVVVLAARPLDGVPCVVVPDVTTGLALLAKGGAARLVSPVSAGGTGLTIAGITGSSGKTSTKDVTAQLCERLGPTGAPGGAANKQLRVPPPGL